MKHYRTIFATILFGLAVVTLAYASSSLGTIDPANVGNYKAVVDNPSLGTATTINFGKFTTQAAKNISVSDSELRGFAWGEGTGWIVTNCADTTSGCSSTNSNFKIANDGSGNLSGFAWGDLAGWINFGPFTNTSVSTVKITNGKFGGSLGNAGYAWAQNFGWIKFDCSSSASCVETDWRPSSGGGTTTGGSVGGGGDTGTGDTTSGPQICANTVSYAPVPLGSSGPVTTTIANSSTIGFAIKTYDSTDPAHTAGDFATENALNAESSDQVSVYTPSANKYILAFEDMTHGDFDYNDLVIEVDLSCPGGGTCPVPTSLGDTTSNTINHSPGGELDLQTILNNTGFILNKSSDQKQYQRWDASSGTTITVTTKFIDRYAGHSFVFGYYTGGTLANFVPIFKTNEVLGAEMPVAPLCVPNPDDACPNISGKQSTIPAGKALDTSGQCVDIVADFCPNIAGSQTTFPSGMVYDANGNCVATAPTGSIKVTGFACSSEPTLSRSVNGPNAQGTFTAPTNCTPVTGAEFGSVFLPGKTSGSGGYPYINGEGIYDVLGKTGSNGQLLKSGLPTQGRYDVAETYNGGIHLPDTSRYALFCYGDGGTWDDNLDYTFVPPNGVTSCVSYRSDDLCPNIAGNQLLVPNGSYIDNQNNCITPANPADLCPNIAGSQTTLPAGKIFNTAGECVAVTVPDACPNIAGYQQSVSSDQMYDATGNCVPAPTVGDLCPNIAGNQQQMPYGYTYDSALHCVQITPPDTCATNPSLCTPAPDACALNPASCTPAPDLCTTNPSSCVPVTDPACAADPSLCTPPPPDTCATNPSLCTPAPDTCATNPSLCTPQSSFCAEHPEVCFPPETSGGLSVMADKVAEALSALASSLGDKLISLRKVVPIAFTSSLGGKIIAFAGLVSLALAPVASFMVVNPVGFSDVFLTISRLWSLFLIFFGFIKKADPWGTVYDSVTKEPIDPAYVILYDLGGNEVATSITDIDGRYGFSVPAGSYTLLVNKTNYAFPSVKLAGRHSDELYGDLYFGGPITVTEDGGIIAKNVPLDQLNFDWNEYAKTEQHRLHRYNRQTLLVSRISHAIFIAGFIITTISFLVLPNVLNIILMALYILMAFGKINGFIGKSKGSVIDAANYQPVPFAIVRVYSNATEREVLHKVSDKLGNYYALIANGSYKVVVDRKNPDESYTSNPVPDPVRVKKGILKELFRVR